MQRLVGCARPAPDTPAVVPHTPQRPTLTRHNSAAALRLARGAKAAPRTPGHSGGILRAPLGRFAGGTELDAPSTAKTSYAIHYTARYLRTNQTSKSLARNSTRLIPTPAVDIARRTNQISASNNTNRSSIMQTPYIPSPDAQFALWLDNLATLIAATPTDYGLVVGDATIISAANTAFQAAFLLATNIATRTAPTIADKDAQRTAATATVRPYCIGISLNAGVSDALKLGVGVNLPNVARTPIPAPTTQPVLVHVASNPGVAQLRYYDVTTPLSKAKPFGATGIEIRQTIGTAPAVAPDAADYVATWTKSPNAILTLAGDLGKTITLWGRWVTKSGPAGVAQFGPWSTALSFAIL